MKPLNENELLYEVGLAFDCKKSELSSVQYDIPEEEYKEKREQIIQAEVQIMALIKNSQLTEKWIKKKARVLFEKGIFYRKDAENQAVISLDWAKDFIHSLVKELAPHKNMSIKPKRKKRRGGCPPDFLPGEEE